MVVTGLAGVVAGVLAGKAEGRCGMWFTQIILPYRTDTVTLCHLCTSPRQPKLGLSTGEKK